MALQRRVALKEYMPSSLAVRGDGPQITLRTSAYADTYGGGGISVGEAHADTNVTAMTAVAIGDSTALSSGLDLTVTASSDHTVAATAKSGGGGFVSGKIAETTARIGYRPTYGARQLLRDLAAYGAAGPPWPSDLAGPA